MYSRKDTNLVFSRFISCGDVLCYNRAKINSFILKCLENSYENQPITPKFVLYIIYILHYTKQSLDLRFRFNAIFFLDFFCITPHTRKIKKSTVEFHTSKTLKMIKQSNQSRQVLFYIHVYVDFM